jgi:hypothetical protein
MAFTEGLSRFCGGGGIKSFYDQEGNYCESPGVDSYWNGEDNPTSIEAIVANYA